MDGYHGGSLFAMATRGEAHLAQGVGWVKNERDGNNPANNKSITLLRIISNIFTKYVYNKLTTWAIEENFIDPEQAGFQIARSTIDHYPEQIVGNFKQPLDKQLPLASSIQIIQEDRFSSKNAPLHSIDIHAPRLADRRIPILLYVSDLFKL
ncbi:hypothetical protein L345_03286, partial [Ophiophagus hannah]